MKVLVILASAVVAGTALGVGSTMLDLRGTKESFETYWCQPNSGKQLALPTDLPKAELVGKAEYDFGAMEVHEKRRHTFKIRSVGGAPLVLKKGKTTCKCTVSKLSGSSFAPGETANVTLEWTSQDAGPDPQYAQTAVIHTNDPQQRTIVLKVHGIIAQSFRALPTSLPLGRVNANEGTSATFRVFGFQTDTVDILDIDYADQQLASYFDVALEPLAGEEVEEEKGAKSGLLAQLTVKSGLPLGPISQTIQLTARGPDNQDVKLKVGVRGTTVGDIMFAGSPRVFIRDRNLLKLGTVDQQAGAEAVLYMFVKGEHRQQTEFSVAATEPERYLDVTISEPQALNEGKTIKRTLTVRVPPGLDPINRTGSESTDYGQIVLKTTHPDHQEVKILVKFSVQ